MEKLRSKIIIEDYKNNFDYKKSDTNLNIEFNRVAFIFFFFFIIYLIYTIHLIHLGLRKSKIELNNDVPTSANKLYRADIIDVNGNYLAKTVKSIDIGIKTSDVIDKKKLLLSLNIIFPKKDFFEDIILKLFPQVLLICLRVSLTFHNFPQRFSFLNKKIFFY